jgi:hypothetical protein
VCTMLRARENGKPRSRANDQVMRDAAARQPIALQNSSKTIMLTMMVAPTFDPTAAWKIRMKGEVAACWSSISPWMSFALKRTAKSMPSAKEPFITRLRSIERGTSVLALRTSSDICKD